MEMACQLLYSLIWLIKSACVGSYNLLTYIEDVTTVDDDYYQDYTETRRAEPESKAAEYIPAHIDCAESPNGYHSWTSVYEWYNGNQLINTGTEPAGGFTSSVYLYSQCDYCGMKNE